MVVRRRERGFSWNEYFNSGLTRSPLYLDSDSVTAGKAMEAIREGAQDYELLRMFEQKLARKTDGAAVVQHVLTNEVERVLRAHTVQRWPWNVPKDRSVAG